jgi:hypothetical protein
MPVRDSSRLFDGANPPLSHAAALPAHVRTPASPPDSSVWARATNIRATALVTSSLQPACEHMAAHMASFQSQNAPATSHRCGGHSPRQEQPAAIICRLSCTQPAGWIASTPTPSLAPQYNPASHRRYHVLAAQLHSLPSRSSQCILNATLVGCMARCHSHM